MLHVRGRHLRELTSSGVKLSRCLYAYGARNGGVQHLYKSRGQCAGDLRLCNLQLAQPEAVATMAGMEKMIFESRLYSLGSLRQVWGARECRIQG